MFIVLVSRRKELTVFLTLSNYFENLKVLQKCHTNVSSSFRRVRPYRTNHEAVSWLL